jgi:hypothetical protein
MKLCINVYGFCYLFQSHKLSHNVRGVEEICDMLNPLINDRGNNRDVDVNMDMSKVLGLHSYLLPTVQCRAHMRMMQHGPYAIYSLAWNVTTLLFTTPHNIYCNIIHF